MVNKEEMVSYIDKSIDSLKEELKKYIDESIEEDNKEKENEFYEKFKSDKVFENKEALYNIYSNKIDLGDIVFGVVYGDDIKDERYPFKVIYKDKEKLILEGIKNTNKSYTFVQACYLRWDIKLMVNQNIIFKKQCRIISKEIIDEFELSSSLSYKNLGVGFCYWTSTCHTDSIYRAWRVTSYGVLDTTGSSSTEISAIPYTIIYL